MTAAVASDAVTVFRLLSCGCKVAKKRWQSNWNLFLCPSQIAAEANCAEKLLPFRHWSESWMFLTISNCLQGDRWLLDLNLAFSLSQVRSESLGFLRIGCSETAPHRSGLQAAALLVFRVWLRVQITPNANWQGSQKNVRDFLFIYLLILWLSFCNFATL